MALIFVSQSLEIYFDLSELDDTSRPQCPYYIFYKTSFLREENRLWHSTGALFLKKIYYFKLVIFKGVGLGQFPQEKKYFNGWLLVIFTKYSDGWFIYLILLLDHRLYPERSYKFMLVRLCVRVSIWNQCCFQGFIQAILMSVRRHKQLNLLTEFWNSIFIKFYFKAFWR